MSFTLAIVKTSLQARGYGVDTTSQQTEFVKAALRRIYGERKWRFLHKTNSTVTIAVSASTCSLAAIADRQAGKLEGVRLVPANGTPLELDELDWETLRAYDAEDSSNDTPLYYARFDNDTLQFWPRADKAYTVAVDYISLPALPAVDGDTIVFPDEHLDLLVDSAAMSLAARQRDWQAYGAWQQSYQDAYAKFARAQQSGSSQSPPRVKHWDGWDNWAPPSAF